jgi:hypothetical protein
LGLECCEPAGTDLKPVVETFPFLGIGAGGETDLHHVHLPAHLSDLAGELARRGGSR